MATTPPMTRSGWRVIGGAAVVLAGAVLTFLCVVNWLVIFGVVSLETGDMDWPVLLVLTGGSMALVGLGIRIMLRG